MSRLTVALNDRLIESVQANLHVANAEDYLTQGLIVLAADEYTKAAEAYTTAIERSNDESVCCTLGVFSYSINPT